MKKIPLLVVLCACSLSLFSQSLNDFFKYEGVEFLSTLAHPTNTYVGGEYFVDEDAVWVRINYETCKTELKISRSGNIFTDVSLVQDTDWFPPFAAISLIKDVAFEYLQTEEDLENMQAIERYIGKTLANMDGYDMCLTALILAWIDY